MGVTCHIIGRVYLFTYSVDARSQIGQLHTTLLIGHLDHRAIWQCDTRLIQPILVGKACDGRPTGITYCEDNRPLLGICQFKSLRTAYTL